MLHTENDKPLYLQLVDVLENKIRETMTANEKLASERELTQIYNVSRITVRLALKELESRGLLYKKHGKGTYVSEISDSMVDLSSMYSFTEQMKKMGKDPETKVLSFQTVEATEHIAKQMHLEQGELVFEIERLRMANHIPMMVERTYVPQSLFAELTAEMLQKRSLYDSFRDLGQVVRQADEEFYASIALENEAQHLNIAIGNPVLHVVRKTYNTKNRVIEYTFSIARADQFRYHISHIQID
ncbi:GntR family transcriptional regulator [Streptococcus cameli]